MARKGHANGAKGKNGDLQLFIFPLELFSYLPEISTLHG
jgi:hypothetical protein